MLDVDKMRYGADKLKTWKNLDKQDQLTIVKNLTSKKYNNIVDIRSVKNQSIEITLHLEKEKRYDFLVEYEAFLRKNLGNFPIIVLLRDRADENRKRK